MGTAQRPEPALGLLLCCDGSEHALPGLDFGVRLAGMLHWPVLLLGALGSRPDALVHEQLVSVVRRLEESGCTYELVEEPGTLVEAIENRAADGGYLSVYSTPHRSFLFKLFRQSSFQRLMVDTQGPLIRLRECRWPLRKLLICVGGLDYAVPLESLAYQLAAAAGASVTLLHVIEPVTLDNALSIEGEDQWQAEVSENTPRGRHLRAALERARASSIDARVIVRHGSVIQEISAEVQEGGYDLVGLGSTYSAESLRHAYAPNIAAEIAMELDLPVLCVRKGPP